MHSEQGVPLAPNVLIVMEIEKKLQYINHAEGKKRLFDAIVLNEANIIHTSVERSVYCKGARAWNSQPWTDNNRPRHEAFKHHQKVTMERKSLKT